MVYLCQLSPRTVLGESFIRMQFYIAFYTRNFFFADHFFEASFNTQTNIAHPLLLRNTKMLKCQFIEMRGIIIRKGNSRCWLFRHLLFSFLFEFYFFRCSIKNNFKKFKETNLTNDSILSYSPRNIWHKPCINLISPSTDLNRNFVPIVN